MATLDTTFLTLADVARRQDKDGAIPAIAELLDKRNDFLSRMTYQQCNMGHEHRTLYRTSIPSATKIQPNAGYPVTKSDTGVQTDTCVRFGMCMEVDKMVANAYGNPGALIASEAPAFIEGIRQSVAYEFLYGARSSDAKGFDGLATRYSASTATNIGMNVLKAGGSGSDNTSIWFLVLGNSTIHGIVPQGQNIGLSHEDNGEDVVIESTGNRRPVLRHFFSWDCGLALRRWDAGVRIANIDVSNLVGESSAADLYKFMIKGYHRIEKVLGMGTPVCLMHPTVFEMLDIQSRTSQTYTLDQSTVEGKLITSFRGIPILPTDVLKVDEATVA